MSKLPFDLRQTIRRIQIQTTHLAADVLAGAYKSAFRGKGMEFEEVHEYIEGDDVRDIDWNVTARMGIPYVKKFREERELTFMLVVDVSGSCSFGSGNRTKNEWIAEIGSLLAFSAIKNNDKVGLILFSNVIEKYVPPKGGVRHVLRVIREILSFETTNKGTDINVALAYLGKVQKRGSICFMISDFLTPPDGHLMALAARKYDLITLRVLAKEEETFPDMGLIEIQDSETSEIFLVDTSDPKTRETFQNKTSQLRTQHDKMVGRIGAGNIDLRTDKPYLPPIQKFFKLRGLRRR